MRFHSSTTTDEFLDWLRYSAIDRGMPPLFIDCVDKLYTLYDMEPELEKVREELSDMEKAKDDLFEELEALVKAIDENLDPDKEPKHVTTAMKMARAALERHST